ncbi:hypothetical protein DMENIID0001_148560 [Sergentomyia squamirostris]
MKVSEEFNFRRWIDDIKSKRDPQKAAVKAKTPSPDPHTRKLPIGLVRTKAIRKIAHLPGTFYGPFPPPPIADRLTQTHDKFLIPHTMTQRAEKHFEKKKVQNRNLRRARLLHMKTPLPPASDGSSDNDMESVRSLTLIKTPYFVIPTFKFQPRRKKDRLRNRFLSKSQLRRISMLLYDRSRITPAIAGISGDKLAPALDESSLEKPIRKHLKPVKCERRSRYRTFIRELFHEKLREFEDQYGAPKEVICFEDFKQSTKDASKPGSSHVKDSETTAPKAELKVSDSARKARRINYQLYRPPNVFTKKRHTRRTKSESSVGPLYLDPNFMEKFRKPKMFTKSQKFYTSTLRDLPEVRDRVNVTSRAFEEERFGFNEKYLHRLATEWDENYVNDLRHRPPARKFCVKTDILRLRDATRKTFSMYYTTENLLNLLQQQKDEEAAIEEVEGFSKICSDFLTNVKNDSYNRVIRKTQALKPLQQKTKELSQKVEELKAELEFVTESVLEEERKWDTLMKLQNYYFLLMEPEWRKANDWIHRTPSGSLREAVDIVENCSKINIRDKTSTESIKVYFEREIFPNIERMKAIQPDPELLRSGLQTLKQKVFTSLNQYNKTHWLYEVFLRQAENLKRAFEKSENSQRKMMKFQSVQETFLEERNYLLNYEVKQVMKKPLERSVRRGFLVDLLEESGEKSLDDRFHYMHTKVANLSKCHIFIVQEALRNFKYQFKQKFQHVGSNKSRFREKNKDWLKKELTIQKKVKSANSKMGRPAKSFEECSEKSKLRRTEKIRKDLTAEELTYAAQKQNYDEGNHAMAKLIKIASGSEAASEEILAKMKNSTKPEPKPTDSEILTLYNEGNFTKRQWTLIHQFARKRIPSYSVLRRIRKQSGQTEEQEAVSDDELEELPELAMGQVKKEEATVKEEDSTLEEDSNSYHPTASRIRIKAICNQLYDFIVPGDRRCPQIDEQMTSSEKFSKLHDFVMELLHQLDRIPIIILHRSEKEIRREQMRLQREAQKAVIKQNRFELLQKQIRGHFK